jgi:hypothetical protein
MVDSPDPLGKRALFWAPAERDESGPRSGVDEETSGKHALFSAPPARGATKGRRRSTATDGAAPTRHHPSGAGNGVRPVRPVGQAPKSGSANGPAGARATHAARQSAGMFGPIGVECSSCGAHSDVDMLEFAMLHLPLWFWRPGRGFTQFMTCPACRRRTWVSASWAPRSR